MSDLAKIAALLNAANAAANRGDHRTSDVFQRAAGERAATAKPARFIRQP